MDNSQFVVSYQEKAGTSYIDGGLDFIWSVLRLSNQSNALPFQGSQPNAPIIYAVEGNVSMN